MRGPPPKYDDTKTPLENLNILNVTLTKAPHCYFDYLKIEIQSLLSAGDMPLAELIEKAHSFFILAGNELSIDYLDRVGPKENLHRLLDAINDLELETPIGAIAPLTASTVKRFYYDALVNSLIQFASIVQKNNREDMYDTMVEFIQRVKMDKPLYDEVVAEFIQKQSFYAKTRNNFLDVVNVPGIRRRKEPEADFVKAFRKEYNK